MSPRITRRQILQGGKVLRLRFEDGTLRDIDLIEESRRGPAFARLADPEYVRGVKRTWDGHLLEWPDGATWSAETLWREAGRGSSAGARKAG